MVFTIELWKLYFHWNKNNCSFLQIFCQIVGVSYHCSNEIGRTSVKVLRNNTNAITVFFDYQRLLLLKALCKFLCVSSKLSKFSSKVLSFPLKTAMTNLVEYFSVTAEKKTRSSWQNKILLCVHEMNLEHEHIRLLESQWWILRGEQPKHITKPKFNFCSCISHSPRNHEHLTEN